VEDDDLVFEDFARLRARGSELAQNELNEWGEHSPIET
jgi:hypothetical protein